MKKHLKILHFSLFLLLIGMDFPVYAQPTIVTINSAVQHQSMQGFGTSTRLFDDPHMFSNFDPTTKKAATVLTTEEKDVILEKLYTDLKLTRVRPIIESFDGFLLETANDNVDPNTTDLTKFDFTWKRNDGFFDYVQRAISRGVNTYFLSPVNLESWMNESNPEECVEMAMAIITRWKNVGIELPYYSIVNEPGYSRSGVWSGEYLRDVIKLLGAKLEAKGFKTKIVTPDDLYATQAFNRCQVILKDSVARKYIGALAFHLYDEPITNVSKMRQLSQTYNIPLWMTEYSQGANGGDAFKYGLLMHNLIADYDVTALDYLWGFVVQNTDGGLISLQFSGTKYTGYVFPKTYYIVGQFSRFIKQGAKRIDALSSSSSVKVTAYKNDDSNTTIIAINTSANPITTAFTFSGFKAKTIKGVRTSSKEDGAVLPQVNVNGSSYTATLPANSITTFVSDTVSIVSSQITVTANADSIGRYNVYELTIDHPISYGNNWEDVKVSAVFSGPKTINIDGFFYNNNVWKVRFAPPETGNWTYAITFTTPSNTYTANGSFTSVPSTTKGFLQRHPNNPFRLVYPDGTLFNGIGIGDCMGDPNKNGTPHDNWGFDGDFRPKGQEEGTDTTLNVYMNAYGVKGAGFNMFRWSINNCAYNMFQNISTSGNTYLVTEGRWGDSLVQALRQNDIRLWLTLFSWNTPFHSSNVVQPVEEAAVNRYIKYMVDRYGAYTDIWELNNETTVSDRWIDFTTTYFRSIDPYTRLISASWPRPSSPFIDINSPHWYEEESEFNSDKRAWENISNDKSFNKPVIYGEQGNSVQNFSALSPLRMRLRSWTAFFAEGMLIFWNGSWAKDYLPTNGAAKIYLGPIERGYIKALQNFTALADTSIRQMTITPSNTAEVRAYGLQSSKIIMGYFHHYSSHANNTATTFTLTMPQAGTLYWINPADNSIIQSLPIANGSQTITSPLFTIDLAMRVSLATTNKVENKIEATGMYIYPNPATDFIMVKFADGGLDSEIEILTTLSQLAIRAINQNRIDVSQLTSGMYFLKVKQGENSYIQKFIKQ